MVCKVSAVPGYLSLSQHISTGFNILDAPKNTKIMPILVKIGKPKALVMFQFFRTIYLHNTVEQKESLFFLTYLKNNWDIRGVKELDWV